MSAVEFSVKYDGPQLASHVMDLQVLGPALMAINDLCREANRVLNGEDVMHVRVDMKATHHGCFNVTLQLTELMQGMSGLLPVVPASQIADALGFLKNGFGLLQLLKWQKGQKIVRQDTGERGVAVHFEGDNNTVFISSDVNKLHKDLPVRMAQRQFVSPLETPGIEKIGLQRDGEDVEVIRKNEAEEGYYDVRPEEVGHATPLLSAQDVEAILQLRAPMFVPNGKWQFSYGPTRIFAIIRDQAFLTSVFKRGRQFGANDYFRVHLRITQEMLPDGKIRNNYEITKIFEVIPGMTQSALFSPGDDVK